MKALPRAPLEAIRIASPCAVPWSDMQGDDLRRRCGRCDRVVHDLSSLSREEAELLVGARSASGERLCVTLFVRSDGTVLTADCPVGLAAVRRRLRWLAAGLGALVAVVAGVVGLRAGDARGRSRGWFAPSPPPARLMGEMWVPPRTRTPPPAAAPAATPTPAPATTSPTAPVAPRQG